MVVSMRGRGPSRGSLLVAVSCALLAPSGCGDPCEDGLAGVVCDDDVAVSGGGPGGAGSTSGASADGSTGSGAIDDEGLSGAASDGATSTGGEDPGLDGGSGSMSTSDGSADDGGVTSGGSGAESEGDGGADSGEATGAPPPEPPPPEPPPPSPVCYGQYTVTAPVAAGHHPGCQPGSGSGWTDCAAASNRFCKTVLDPACGPVSGFASEFDGGNDAMLVTCVAGDERQTDYGSLQALHGSCNGASAGFRDAYGLYCNSAFHRQCAAAGFVSGFGPIEVSPPVAQVHCLSAEHATVVSTTMAALTAQHGGCTDALQDLRNCQAASRRLCVAQGFAGGYGPVEAGPAEAYVVCVQ